MIRRYLAARPRVNFSGRWLCTALVAAALAMAAPQLAGAEDDPVRVGKTFIATSLDPTNGSAGWALVSHGIAEQLFMVSREGKIEPRLARDAVQNEDGSWTVTLAEGRAFSDGTPVTADRVAEALNRTADKGPAVKASAGRISFAVAGPSTLTVTTEEATPILPSILAEWAFPVYRMQGERFYFTGPFAVEAFAAGSHIDLVPNPHHPEAADLPAVTLQKVADGQTMAVALRAGELDLGFHLPVETLGLVRADPNLTVKSFPVAYQYMMWMNTARPALSDPRVRRAIDLAIDRNDLVQAAQAGKVATGAFSTTYPFALEEPIAAAPAEAALLLDQAGWTVGADGWREKDGEVLALRLLAYPQRPDLLTFQPVVRAALGELGIRVTTQVTEEPGQVATSGAFDLALWARHTAPAGDPLQFLALTLETDAPNNYARWSNPAFDAIIAELRTARHVERRTALAKQAQRIVMAEAPVSFLVTPQWHVGVSKRLAGYEPWGSDYYVLRSDLRAAD